MINLIWLLLLVTGISYAAFHGRIEIVTQSAISAAEGAVALSFKLVGVMCLWLGIMRIAELAGIVKLISYVVSPLVSFIFPSVPKNHPAMGAIIMTLSANMLGLGNAVTPLGIKAMQALQQLNAKKRYSVRCYVYFISSMHNGIYLDSCYDDCHPLGSGFCKPNGNCWGNPYGKSLSNDKRPCCGSYLQIFLLSSDKEVIRWVLLRFVKSYPYGLYL